MSVLSFGACCCNVMRPVKSTRRKALLAACVAHVLHDGYTDQLYALLPVWQSEFGLSYAGLAVVRALYYGTMGGLQVPGDRLVARLSPRLELALATFVGAAGYLVMALPFGFPSLCIGLVIAGIGSSVQHPRASLLVTNTYGKASRGPLGIYNFAGDLGKATFPAAVALLLPVFAWRPVVAMMSLVGLTVAVVLLALLPRQPFITPVEDKSAAKSRNGRGFGLLFIIGARSIRRHGWVIFCSCRFSCTPAAELGRLLVWASRYSSSEVRSARRHAAGLASISASLGA
jgi:cyanate permease